MPLWIKLVGVALLAGLLVWGSGWLSARILRPRATGRPRTIHTHVLALVLRFFGVMALCIVLAACGGNDRVALVSAAAAAYFAAIALDAWRVLKQTRVVAGGTHGSGKGR